MIKSARLNLISLFANHIDYFVHILLAGIMVRCFHHHTYDRLSTGSTRQNTTSIAKCFCHSAHGFLHSWVMPELATSNRLRAVAAWTSVKHLALKIGYFRMQCGNITQESLASKINRSREFLAKIEKGTEHPSVATLVDIADTLCISVDDLLIDSLHYSVSTSNTELHRLLLDCNETEQEIIIRTAWELKATLVSLGI